LAIFALQPGSGDVVEAHPFPEIIGRKPGELTIAANSSLEVLIDNPGLFENVDPATEYVPVKVSGVVRNNLGPIPEYVAIGVNGKIQAVTRIKQGPVNLWSTMLQEEALASGKNDISLFGVSGESANLILLPARQHSVKSFSDQAVVSKSTLFNLEASDISQFRFNKSFRLNQPLLAKTGDLHLEAIDGKASIILPKLEYGDRGIMVTVDISVPADSKLKVYYLSKDMKKYQEGYKVMHNTREGRRIYFLPIKEKNLHGSLRLDPGKKPGNYIIHALTIQPL